MSDEEISELRREMREDTKTILREIGKVHGRIGENEKEIALVKQDIGNHIESHKWGAATTAVVILVIGGASTLLVYGIRAWVAQ